MTNQKLSEIMPASMRIDADNKEQMIRKNSASDLLEDVKDIRNDMVARNYPFQVLSNLITEWEEKLK
tara:strand:+ start:320 stop:520 length:201 start_codon:yes stop_codon:yes gene_type:complete